MPATRVHDLPTELLQDIFYRVFSDTYTICSPEKNSCMTCRRIRSAHVLWGPTESFDLADRTQFPFALAGVCSRWRQVLATVPEYWTRPVIYIDDPPTSPTDVRDFLAFSQGLPIEIYIVRRNPHSQDLATVTERRRVRTAIDYLKPHLPRCQFVFIRVALSSSLPSLRHDFTGKAPVLTQLKLECQIDDGVNPEAHVQSIGDISNAQQKREEDVLCCPSLYTLSIDGPNFREICYRYPNWWAASLRSVRCLMIQNLSPCSALEPDRSLEFSVALSLLHIQILPELRSLFLSNLHLNISPDLNHTADTPDNDRPWSLVLHLLHLTSLPLSLVSHFFKRTFLGDLYSVLIESCELPSSDTVPLASQLGKGKERDNNQTHADVTIDVPSTFNFSLRNMTHSAAIKAFLRTWLGRRLNVDSSSGFDDSVLKMLHSHQPFPTASPSLNGQHVHETRLHFNDDNGAGNSHKINTQNDHPLSTSTPLPTSASQLQLPFYCPNLSRIALTNCNNFTASAARQMVETRNFQGSLTGPPMAIIDNPEHANITNNITLNNAIASTSAAPTTTSDTTDATTAINITPNVNANVNFNEDVTISAIQALTVRGTRVPEIDEETRTWFEKELQVFEWGESVEDEEDSRA